MYFVVAVCQRIVATVQNARGFLDSKVKNVVCVITARELYRGGFLLKKFVFCDFPVAVHKFQNQISAIKATRIAGEWIV